MNLNLSDLHGRPVLDVDTATTLGEIDGVVIDCPAGRIAALTVAKSSDRHTVLPWESIKHVGPDAVTVEGTGALRPPDGPYESGVVDGSYEATGKRILTIEGDAAGKVDDVVLDPESGSFVALIVDGAALPAARVVAIGDFAAIITAD